jgi:heme/copper-type cytochrome/quinol oxidase subunit 4
MRHHLRIVAVLAVALVTYGVLIQALHWMSQPSDRAWYGGIAIILGLFLLVPILVREIWRRL